jgi:hypothetical protein
MIATNLIPRPWRRAIIDSVYGAEDDRGVKIYLGLLWGGLLLLSLILAGLTPWAWPAEREGRVTSLEQVSCDAILGEEEAADRADSKNQSTRSTTKTRGKAPAATGSRNACRQLLTDAERSQLTRAEETVSYLQRGGGTPQPLAIPSGTPLRDWIDSRICRMSGADSDDRGALAWHVGQGIGECGGWSRTAAQFPLSIMLGPILGIILTPLILLLLIFFAARHSLRLPATRRAYRRLYGSEHKAP